MPKLILIFALISSPAFALTMKELKEIEAAENGTTVQEPARKLKVENYEEPPAKPQPFLCADGRTYVAHAPCTRCPDGTYVGGKCNRVPNGGYVGD